MDLIATAWAVRVGRKLTILGNAVASACALVAAGVGTT